MKKLFLIKGIIAAVAVIFALSLASCKKDGKDGNEDEVVEVSGIKFTKTNITIAVNKTANLEYTITPSNATNQEVTFKSSNVKVATVDDYGRVEGVSEGTATITVKAKDGSGVKATCTVNCKEENLDYKYTQTDYYMWDAYKPYEYIITGTWGEGSSWYNETTTELASASCKDCPTAQQMVAYLKAGVYWDDNTTVAEGKKTYTLDGKTTESYTTGLWVKKRLYIDNFDYETDEIYSTTPMPLSTLGNEDVIKIRTSGEYFFLPACGYYNSGSFHFAGTYGYYWSSTPIATNAYSAYFLNFTSGYASVCYHDGYYLNRNYGYVPMPRL